MDKKTKDHLSELLYSLKEALTELPPREERTMDDRDLALSIGYAVHVLEEQGFAPKKPDELVIPLSGNAALVAYDKCNPDYPGGGISYRTPDGDDVELLLAEGDGPVTDNDPEDCGEAGGYGPDNVRLYIYGDVHRDDFTEKVVVSRNEMDTLYKD